MSKQGLDWVKEAGNLLESKQHLEIFWINCSITALISTLLCLQSSSNLKTITANVCIFKIRR